MKFDNLAPSLHHVGTRWTNLMIEHGIGADQSHPIEAQRVYMALLERREPDEVTAQAHPFTYLIEAQLDDIDSTILFARDVLAGSTHGDDTKTIRASVEAMERVVQKLARSPAFRGAPIPCNYDPLPAYRAFRCAIAGKNNKPFVPVKRLAKCDKPQVGIIYPYQMTSPAWLNGHAVYCFVPDGEELEDPMRIALRARKKVSAFLR